MFLSSGANRRIFRRPGMSMIELLIVVTVIVILLALLLPALSRMRETTRRTVCQSNLHNIGIALMQYEAAARYLPAGRDAQQGRDHSWATSLLPYLGHSDLFARYDFNRPWNDSTGQSENGRVAATALSIFVCPATAHDDPGATDYAGNRKQLWL